MAFVYNIVYKFCVQYLSVLALCSKIRSEQQKYVSQVLTKVEKCAIIYMLILIDHYNTVVLQTSICPEDHPLYFSILPGYP